mgnify:FL=1
MIYMLRSKHGGHLNLKAGISDDYDQIKPDRIYEDDYEIVAVEINIITPKP